MFRRSLEFFSTAHLAAAIRTDPDCNAGELIVSIPPDASHLVGEGRGMRVAIEFSIEQPQGGLHFVIPECEGTLVEVNSFEFEFNHNVISTLYAFSFNF